MNRHTLKEIAAALAVVVLVGSPVLLANLRAQNARAAFPDLVGLLKASAGRPRGGRCAHDERQAGHLRVVRKQAGHADLVLQRTPPEADAAVLPARNRRPGGPLTGVPDDGRPVMAIASVTMPAPPQNGDLKAATITDRDRAVRAAAGRAGRGRPVCAVDGQGARFDRGADGTPVRGPEVDWPRRWRSRSAFWSRVVAGNAAGALLAVLVFTGATWQTPWQQILGATASTFAYSFCCSSLGFLAIPRLAPVAWRRLPAPLQLGGDHRGTRRLRCGRLRDRRAARESRSASRPPGERCGTWQASLRTVDLLHADLRDFLHRNRGAASRGSTGRRWRCGRRNATRPTLIDWPPKRSWHRSSRVSDPHFLFNTLNSVSELVHENPAAAERVVGQLASLMRSSLERGAAPLVPLEQELGFVRNYLEIEGVRFGDRLRYELTIGDDAAQTLGAPSVGCRRSSKTA